MKKITRNLLVAAGCMMLSLSAMAQSKALYLSSVSGTKVAQYDGQTRNITMYRNVYTGWNTLCVPFDMTADELNTTFGQSCRLEKLQSVTLENGTYYLNFTDVKAEGLKANTPYLLYYTGENKSLKLAVDEAVVHYDADPCNVFSVGGAKIKFAGATTHIEANGQFGIYVRDNAEANFAEVSAETTGFYATRCYITATGVSNPKFVSRHGDDATAIRNIAGTAAGTTDGAVYDLNGVRQNSLQQGVNVVEGKKVYVK